MQIFIRLINFTINTNKDQALIYKDDIIITKYFDNNYGVVCQCKLSDGI